MRGHMPIMGSQVLQWLRWYEVLRIVFRTLMLASSILGTFSGPALDALCRLSDIEYIEPDQIGSGGAVVTQYARHSSNIARMRLSFLQEKCDMGARSSESEHSSPWAKPQPRLHLHI